MIHRCCRKHRTVQVRHRYLQILLHHRNPTLDRRKKCQLEYRGTDTSQQQENNICSYKGTFNMLTFAATAITSGWLLNGHHATHADFPLISVILVLIGEEEAILKN